MSENVSLWKQIYARMTAIAEREPYVKVGVLASKGGDETDSDGGPTMVELLAIHEYGALVNVGERSRVSDRKVLPAAEVVIPERAPLRRTFAANRAEMAKLTAPLAKAVMLGKMSIDRALGLLGAWGVSEVRKTIAAGLPPPNAPSTIARKGSSTPLEDTGRLVGALAFEVVGGNGGSDGEA